MHNFIKKELDGKIRNIKVFLRPYILPSIPRRLHIEITNYCNLRCIMCPYDKMKRKKGFMDFKLYKKIIDDAAKLGIPRIRLFLFGDPLLHPLLPQMIKYAKDKGIKNVDLDTNAKALTKILSEKIINAGLDEITFSFEGGTKKTYEKIMRGGNFENTKKNIKEFIKIRNRLGRKKPFIYVQSILMRDTASEIENFKNLWSNLADKVSIFPVNTMAGQVKDLSIKKNFVKKSPCLRLWSMLAIYWNGDVAVCCVDIDEKLKIGNVKENSISEIWKESERLNALRKLHHEGKRDKIPLCKYCEE